MHGTPGKVVNVAHALCLFFEAFVNVISHPKPVNELYHAAARPEEGAVGQVACVHRHVHSCGPANDDGPLGLHN